MHARSVCLPLEFIKIEELGILFLPFRLRDLVIFMCIACSIVQKSELGIVNLEFFNITTRVLGLSINFFFMLF